MRLEGRSVLVTGATGGIGSAIARDMDARGCAVRVTSRRATHVERLVSELGPSARGFAADLTKLDEINELSQWAAPVDVLVANAGVEIPQDLASVSDAELDQAIRVNLLAPAALARAALTPMIERGAGHIVLIASLAGMVATQFNGSVYTATKWGLRGLGLALRQELHGTGVGVSTIFPGPIRDAGMFARTGVALPKGTGTSSPQDVARAVARAVERNRAEVTVAPVGMRLSSAFGSVAPVLSGTIARLGGANKVRENWIASLTSERGSGE